jgi:hypothetical protein
MLLSEIPMHAINTALIHPRAPRSQWAEVEGRQPSHDVSRREHHRALGSNAPGRHTPTRGTQFAQQAIHTDVMNRLAASFTLVARPTLPGLAPDQQASQNFAAAAGQMLAAGNDGAQALQNAVELGLQEAAHHLQGLGVSAEDIAAAADALRGQLEGLISASGTQGEIAVGGRLTEKQRTKLEIITQEGDVVKLSLRTRITTTLSGAAVNGSNGTAAAAQGTTIVGNKLELSVEGNLNAEEAAAIRHVLMNVEEMAEDFFAGDLQAAFAAASDLGIDGEQLASVAIKMSSRQRMTATGFLTQPLLPPTVPQPVVAAPSNVPSVDASATVTTIPQTAATPVAAPALPEPQASAGPTPSAPATAPTPESPAAESPVISIGRYLTQVLRGLSTETSSMNLRLKFDLLLSATRLQAEPAAATVTAPTAAAIAKLEEATNALSS